MGALLDQRREPILNVPAVVVALLLILGLVHGVREYVLSDDADRNLIWTLAFVPARYDTTVLTEGVLPGGWGADLWTFVTYALLHADITHLGFNAVWLLAFASPVARRFGAGASLVFPADGRRGCAGLSRGPCRRIAPMVGASAGISGMMGAAARFAFEPGGSLDMWHGEHAGRPVPAAPLSGFSQSAGGGLCRGVVRPQSPLMGLGTFAMPGMEHAIAWQAHIGGFAVGLLAFALFDPVSRSHDPRHGSSEPPVER